MYREVPIERKALYNLLRMQWIHDPSTEMEPWKVENLRALPLEELFNRLQQEELWLDGESFKAYADAYDSPEEMTDHLIGDRDLELEEMDQVFLVIFEIWRRILPERQSLTIFCDQFDHLILEHDLGQLDDPEQIQDYIENLLTILVESTDEGNDPLEVFEAICSRCANDLEEFLYNYSNDLIEEGQISYASDLLDGLLEYVFDLKWFLLLKSKILSFDDPNEALEIVEELIEENRAEPDLSFLLELLQVIVEVGDDQLFFSQVKEGTTLVRTKEDFSDLLQITLEYFQRQDRDHEAEKVSHLLSEVTIQETTSPFSKSSPPYLLFTALIDS